MASASSPTPNSKVLAQSTSRSRRRQMVMVVTCMVLLVGLVFSRQQLGALFLPIAAGLMTLMAASFWYLHLQSGGLPGAWSFLFSCLLAGHSVVWFWRHPGEDGAQWLGALGCAAFTYVMLWVFAVHHREAGLRSLATAALLLSIGILAKPPVLICCALLTVAVFFDERRRMGSLLYSALLLLTPVLLCTLGVDFLRTLRVESVAHWDWGTVHPSALHLYSLSRQIPSLPFCAAVLTVRLLTRKIASSDLAFLFLLITLPTLGMVSWMPQPLSTVDVSMVLTCGAACLLALDPPVTTLTRLVAFGGLSLSLYFCG